MADLIGKKRSEPVRQIGADPVSGNETNFAGVDDYNRALSVDAPVTSGIGGNISVTTTAIELKVGSSKLSGRQTVSIQPKGRKVFFGYSNTVTSATGTEVFKNQSLFIPVGPNQSIWLISDQAAGVDTRITES